MKAVKSVFDVPCYICDFHREQAWEHWLTKKDNLPQVYNRNILFRFWRNLASWKYDEEFDIHFAEMHNSTQWLKNENVQKYFYNIWITKKNIGAERFLSLIFYSLSTTNNGLRPSIRSSNIISLIESLMKNYATLLILLLIHFWQSSWWLRNIVHRSFNGWIRALCFKNTHTYM